jgi:pimeloyl-ACP methyl ester carboxylesterase
VSGAGEVALTWAPVLDALAARGRVVAYDRAGLGESDPPGLLSGAGEVDDLVALLDAVGTAVVVGHSWGGLLVQLATWARPGQVTGVVLVDPTHEDVEVPHRLRWASDAMFGAVGALHRAHLTGRMLRGMGRSLADAASDDPEVRDLIATAYAASYVGRVPFRTMVEENRIADRCRPWVAPLRRSSSLPDVPVVVLSATDKPPWLLDQTLRLHHDVAAAAPRGRCVEVDTGHYVHRERPEAVIEAVDEVLAG